MGIDQSTADAYDKDGNKLTGDDVLKNPVNYVNWYDAIVYCNRLSIKEGLTPCYTISNSTDPDTWGSVPISYSSNNDAWNAAACNFEADGYRLPTEAEWEWLARGGENYTYAGSNTIEDVAWYVGNTNKSGSREVKTKNANAYGLYDMSGNGWEWCWDWSGSISSSTGAFGASSGNGRVLRGGCWQLNNFYCEVAYRHSFNHYLRNGSCGFRLVRTAQ
jgi:formylglycine-generating enzyme required for sulfatase activity